MYRDRVKAFLERELMVTFGEADVLDDTNLFEEGIIDSFAFVQLVTFLEAEFRIKFTDEEIAKQPLTSLNGICRVLEDKQSDD